MSGKAPDDNARAQEGTLPSDPFADAEPFAASPEAEAEHRERMKADEAAGKAAEAAILALDEAALPPELRALVDRVRKGKQATAVLSRTSKVDQLDPRALLAELGPSPADWFTEPPPKRPVLLSDGLKPVLHRGVVGLLVAPGGAGKSQALVQLALAVAQGKPWLAGDGSPGFAVEDRGRVLLALAEEDNNEIRRRVYRAAYAENGNKPLTEAQAEALRDNLLPLGLCGRRVGMLNEENELNADWAEALRVRLAELGPWSLLVLDPLSRWGGPNVETDNYAATQAVTMLESLTGLPGNPAVVMAHHTNKGALSGDRTDQGAARGSSGLVDGARWVANLDLIAGRTDRVRFHVTKSNYAARPPELFLQRGKHGRLVPMSEGEMRAAKEEEEEGRIQRAVTLKDHQERVKERIKELKAKKGEDGAPSANAERFGDY